MVGLKIKLFCILSGGNSIPFARHNQPSVASPSPSCIVLNEGISKLMDVLPRKKFSCKLDKAIGINCVCGGGDARATQIKSGSNTHQAHALLWEFLNLLSSFGSVINHPAFRIFKQQFRIFPYLHKTLITTHNWRSHGEFGKLSAPTFTSSPRFVLCGYSLPFRHRHR